MRKGYSTQLRLGSLPIDQVPLNLDCRDRIVPILRALQQVYSKPDVTAGIMKLIERGCECRHLQRLRSSGHGLLAHHGARQRAARLQRYVRSRP